MNHEGSHLKPIIFKSIFGESWHQLPSIMHKHYANRAFTSDKVIIEGHMKIEMSLLGRLLSPFMYLTRTLVPFTSNQVQTTVHFNSDLKSNTFHFNRTFYFPNKKPYHFHSYMQPLKNNQIIEFMKCGIGWHAFFEVIDNKIQVNHLGYKLKFFGKVLKIPLEILFGRGYAEEEAIDDNNFRMLMTISHKLFGRIYAYSGQFKITQMHLNG